MQTQNHRYALRALAAADIATTLADEIQVIYDRQLAIAKEATIQQAKSLIQSEIAALPKFLGVDLDDDGISKLIDQFL